VPEEVGLAVDVREVANAVLDVAERENFKITNVSLNKITFFAHGWYLAFYDSPLVDSLFEAWQYGPVHPQIHRQLKKFKNRQITQKLTRIDMMTGEDVVVIPNLTNEQREVIEKATGFYGKYSGSKLIRISHESGAPWDQVWREANGKSSPGMIVPDELIRNFYKGKLARKS
jgi:uncharacterized phage-associated protein